MVVWIQLDGAALAGHGKSLFGDDLATGTDVEFAVAGISGVTIGQLDGDEPPAFERHVGGNAGGFEFAGLDIGRRGGVRQREVLRAIARGGHLTRLDRGKGQLLFLVTRDGTGREILRDQFLPARAGVHR